MSSEGVVRVMYSKGVVGVTSSKGVVGLISTKGVACVKCETYGRGTWPPCGRTGLDQRCQSGSRPGFGRRTPSLGSACPACNPSSHKKRRRSPSLPGPRRTSPPRSWWWGCLHPQGACSRTENRHQSRCRWSPPDPLEPQGYLENTHDTVIVATPPFTTEVL